MPHEREIIQSVCVNGGCSGRMFLHIVPADPMEVFRNPLGTTVVGSKEVRI